MDMSICVNPRLNNEALNFRYANLFCCQFILPQMKCDIPAANTIYIKDNSVNQILKTKRQLCGPKLVAGVYSVAWRRAGNRRKPTVSNSKIK